MNPVKRPTLPTKKCYETESTLWGVSFSCRTCIKVTKWAAPKSINKEYFQNTFNYSNTHDSGLLQWKGVWTQSIGCMGMPGD